MAGVVALRGASSVVMFKYLRRRTPGSRRRRRKKSNVGQGLSTGPAGVSTRRSGRRSEPASVSIGLRWVAQRFRRAHAGGVHGSAFVLRGTDRGGRASCGRVARPLPHRLGAAFGVDRPPAPAEGDVQRPSGGDDAKLQCSRRLGPVGTCLLPEGRIQGHIGTDMLRSWPPRRTHAT